MNLFTLAVSRYFLPLSIFSYLVGFAQHLFKAIDRGHFYALDWKITQYHINYIDFGLVKRGLFGTISYPIFSLLPDAGVAERLFII